MFKLFIPIIFCFILLFSNAQNSSNISNHSDKNISLDSLKILSWNIYMLPPMLKFTGKKKRAKAIGTQLNSSDHDLIIFQEAFNRGSRRKIIKAMQNTYPYKIGPAFKSTFSLKTSDGIWMISKYPIEEIDKIKYKAKKGIDRMAKKGALMVKLIKNRQEFYAIGTHLNAAGPDEIKISQLYQLKNELLNKFEKDSIPIIIAGDLNVDKYQKKLYDSLISILQVEDYPLEGDLQLTCDYTMNTLAYGKSQNWIDYIFLIKNKLKIEANKRQVKIIESQWSKKHKSLSDHHAVEMKLYYQKTK